MSLIDVPDAFPQMIMAVLRFAHREGETTLDEIAMAIVPDSLGAADNVAKSRTRVRSAVRAACAAGMLVDMGDSFQVAKPWSAAANLEASPEAFSTTLVSQLRSDAPPGLQDLVRAAAWVLMQPPFERRLDVDSMGLLLREFPKAKAPAQPTKEQLGPMAVWLDYLGIARRWSSGKAWMLVPDPTRLVARLVQADVTVGVEESVASLLDQWTERYPFLPGGAVSAAVAADLGLPAWKMLGDLPGSWALAFRSLEKAGVIRLVHDADARRVFHLTGFAERGTARPFERIVRGA